MGSRSSSYTHNKQNLKKLDHQGIINVIQSNI